LTVVLTVSYIFDSCVDSFIYFWQLCWL